MPKRRCHWATSPPNIAYHDCEWGVPLHDDCKLFELLILEGAQAGLSWSTILNKRGNYRRAFDGFDAARIARYRPSRVRRLLANPGIVRNRLKIKAAIVNAKAKRLAPIIDAVMARKPASDHPPLPSPDYSFPAIPRAMADRFGGDGFHEMLDHFRTQDDVL